MRLIILIVCALVASGVFAQMFFAIWNSRREVRSASSRRSVAMEFVWTTIPCLMIVAAASPAAIAIAGAGAGDSRALLGKWLSSESWHTK